VQWRPEFREEDTPAQFTVTAAGPGVPCGLVAMTWVAELIV
jgi:hypothetical protein